MSEALHLLAFDWGLKTIGVAVGNTLGATARPLTQIAARDGVPRWEQVGELLTEWRPDVVVVGLPINMDDSTDEYTEAALRFGRRIAGRFGVTVEFQDERLTSVEAAERAGPGSQRQDRHGIAAQVIAEDWIHARAEANR